MHSYRYLGIYIDNNLKQRTHVEVKFSKLQQKLYEKAHNHRSELESSALLL